MNPGSELYVRTLGFQCSNPGKNWGSIEFELGLLYSEKVRLCNKYSERSGFVI